MHEHEISFLMHEIKAADQCLGGYRGKVPVGEVYPARAVGNTKMRHLPIGGTLLAPIFLLGLGTEHVIRIGGGSAPMRTR